jgi:plasmid stabilization system protein ParE
MTFRVKPTAAAKQDARKILAWLRSQQAGEAGLRWFRGMQKAIASLSELPTRCTLAPENKDFPFEVRQLLYGSTHHAIEFFSRLRTTRSRFSIFVTVAVIRLRTKHPDPLALTKTCPSELE